MKTHPIITSTFIAGALLLLGTGCADTGKDNTVENTGASASASATLPDASASPSASAAAATPEEEKKAVVAVAQSFYDTIKDKEVIDKLKASSADFGVAEPSEDQIKKLVTDNPEAFGIFDTSTTENIKNAYVQLVMGSSIANMGENISFKVPAEAITLNEDGKSAVIDPTFVQVFSGEKLLNDPATTEVVPAPEESKVKVVKQDGKWVMIPLTLQGNEAPVASSTEVPAE